MNVAIATDQQRWETFLTRQQFQPFLQSWTMGEVYRDIGQEPIRLEVQSNGELVGICQAIVVPARRGKHLMVQYGPLIERGRSDIDPNAVLTALTEALKDAARAHGCSFLRISPFLPEADALVNQFSQLKALPSPLHLLSEYTWYIPLRSVDAWSNEPRTTQSSDARSEDSIKAAMRSTTRNLIGRAQREGVTVTASSNPIADLDLYFALQEETYKRHGFVPYRESYIRAQVAHFAPKGQAIVYVARYQNEAVAASVHMTYGGVTSYHHGASTQKYAKIPASYLLQWTAISDALKRGDSIYNFWGIAPRKQNEKGDDVIINRKHPFAGVTTFKTGFGGNPLPLMHCVDIPVKNSYYVTRAFEFVRKWKRGF